MSRRPTRRRTAVDETADDERAYGTDGYWQRRYTARAQGSGLGASAAGVQEDVTYATQARTPDWQTGSAPHAYDPLLAQGRVDVRLAAAEAVDRAVAAVRR